MSLQLDTVHVQDERLSISEKCTFSVQSSAESVNQQSFVAISKSTSQINWNVNVPSLTTVIDRRVLMKMKIRFSITGVPAATKRLVDFSVPNCGLQSLPIHQLFSTLTAQINNATVSLNAADVLTAFTRMLSRDDVLSVNGTSPCYPDNYFYLKDGKATSNNPLNAYNSSEYAPEYRGRNSYLLSIVGGDNSPGDGQASKTVQLEVELCEAIILSPFVFNSSGMNSQGFYGVNTITLTANLNQTPKNFFTHTGENLVQGNIPTVQLIDIYDPTLQFIFLSPTAQQLSMYQSVASLPYMDCPRYIQGQAGQTQAGQSSTITSANLALNGIPDRVAIFVRKSAATKTCLDSDFMMAINSIKINFNNRSGILSSSSPYQLWQMSKQAGNHAQGWLEWSGRASVSTGQDGALQQVPTAGSLLLLEFGRHIPLANIYESASSYGQFNFQVEVNYTNQGADAITPELVLVMFNSGVFSTQQGTSASYVNVLSRSDIMNALEQAPISSVQYERMLGSGLWDKIKSAARWVHRQLPQAKKLIQEHIKHPVADKAVDILSTLGYGKSGGLKARVK